MEKKDFHVVAETGFTHVQPPLLVQTAKQNST